MITAFAHSLYSLLFGNIGLVIILGLVMYFSGKVDWYSGIKNIQP